MWQGAWRMCFVVTLAIGVASVVRASENLVGVYSDALGDSACVSGLGPTICYVVASNVANSDGILGWQFALRIQGSGWLFAPALPPDSINIESFPRMRVGCAAPIPNADQMVLLTFSAYSSGPAHVYIDPLTPFDPALLLLASNSELVHLDFEYGGYGAPVFAMGGADCPALNTEAGVVADEQSSWGATKIRYR